MWYLVIIIPIIRTLRRRLMNSEGIRILTEREHELYSLQTKMLSNQTQSHFLGNMIMKFQSLARQANTPEGMKRLYDLSELLDELYLNQFKF